MRKLTVPILLTMLLVGLGWISYNEDLNLYWQSVIMFMGINIMMSSSLNIVNGYMGEFACGHAGFMAVGAYVSSILSVWLFANDRVLGAAVLPPESSVFLFPVVLLIGGIVASFFGLLVAIPSFKTRGDYLAIITIAANYIVKSTIENVDAVGGARGFMGMGKVISAMEKVAEIPWMMIWVFVGTIFTIVIIRRFVTSTYGKGIIAINQDEIAAEIMSVNTNKMKIIAFMLSAGLAGMAGALFAHVLGYVNPGSFTIMKSTEALVMVYLGGMGSLTGSVLSAILFTVMMEGFRFVFPVLNDSLHYINLLPDGYDITQVWKWVLIPLLLVLLMQFRPEGIMGNRELSDIFPKLKRFYSFK
ncbi:branched-chain amino acid ABC transporter permease [Desulfovibrio inopinatus]|uniref:branched-chain amino acid ABC transporter permease n=1 Tax=Desulfovibrio inopinatus TaxID=102109 RepID=UPI000484E256|nr:branched-chain amino acid ABC transporter permease [Desulfovibrio inopinatus]